MAEKTVSGMIYNVSSGMLSSTISLSECVCYLRLSDIQHNPSDETIAVSKH